MFLSALHALKPWTNPSLTGIARLRPRAYGQPYPSAQAALADQDAQVLSLNGTWRFKLLPRPEECPEDFPQPSFVDADFGAVQVPGCFTMQGHGRPHYSNITMPFMEKPPQVPKENPTGLYRHHFSVPRAWKGRRLILRFHSLESCGSVWVNGEPVCLIKDSRNMSECDISHCARVGDNLLCVQVIQWSDASFLEDQDQWWQAGIARDVELLAYPQVHIEDVGTRCDWDPQTQQGHLWVEVRAHGLPEADYQVQVQVYNQRGKSLLRKALSGTLPWFAGNQPHAMQQAEGVLRLESDIATVLPWSHETPQLYTLVVSLYDPQGQEIDATRQRIGFRRVRIENRELLLNGKAVLIKGVNRHEHHECLGKAITREHMEADVLLLKRFGFNAVRCSHYTPHPYFLELCDQHGLWVIDECNIETHHYYRDLTNDPQYAQAFLDRGMRMVLRDRNHPCIFAWSLGNESGYGPNHDAMAGWIRHADPSRILHYEGAICSNWAGGHAASDLVCPMYATIHDMVNWAQTTSDWRPFIQCEYAHAMGNSCGSLSDYWQAFETHHGLQGGFIWEMFDHGIRSEIRDGAKAKPGWLYGGDFGDTPNDYNFVCDGLFFPDRTPHVQAYEAAALFQPLRMELLSAVGLQVRLENRYDWLSLGHLQLHWELALDGQVCARGRLPRVDCAAGASQTVQIPGAFPADAQGEGTLDVIAYDTRSLPWLQKKEPVARCQVHVGTRTGVPAPLPRAGRAQYLRAKSSHTLEGGARRFQLDEQSGELALEEQGQSLLRGGAVCLWRAPTDNDGYKLRDLHRNPLTGNPWMDKPLRRWMLAGYDRAQNLIQPIKRCVIDGNPGLRWETRTHGDDARVQLRTRHTWSMAGDGTLFYEGVFHVPKGMDDLPRLGLAFTLHPELRDLAWFGPGPHEAYSDRRACTRLGQFQCSIAERHHPHIMPQENGHFLDLRWLHIRGPSAQLQIHGQPCFEATVSPYSLQELLNTLHQQDLPEPGTPTLILDAAHRGLGSASCGPDVLSQYRIGPGSYRLAFRLC